MKTQEQALARKLRADGLSVKEIERALNVSRSSGSRWVRDVQLSPQHRAALAARVGEGRLLEAARKVEAARATRLTYQANGRERARESDAFYVQTIYGSLQELGGFDRAAWLD